MWLSKWLGGFEGRHPEDDVKLLVATQPTIVNPVPVPQSIVRAEVVVWGMGADAYGEAGALWKVGWFCSLAHGVKSDHGSATS